METDIGDRSVTSGAFGRKHAVKVVLAVGFAILLVEVVRSQRCATSSALEALRMPWLSHSVDEVVLQVIELVDQWIIGGPFGFSPTHVFDGEVTAGALWRKQFVKVILAIRFAVLLVEVFRTEGFSALSAVEALGVPRPAHRTHLVALQVRYAVRTGVLIVIAIDSYSYF